MSEQSVIIEVEDGVTLSGGYTPAGRVRGLALVTHPHPLYGGSMHNNVVSALVRAAGAAGLAALRFNFRGVGKSTGSFADGVGEVRDVIAAAQWLRGQAEAPLVLLGYSFGALVASNAANGLLPVAAGVFVGFPLVLGELSPWPEQAGPLRLIAGDQDQFTDIARLRRHAEGLGARGSFLAIKGSDHFLWGRESALAEDISSFLSNLPI